MPDPRLSVVLPCYNEAKGLEKILARFDEVRGDAPLELILVDNGSTDETPAVLGELLPGYSFARSIRVDPNVGYGHGILQGLKTATGEVLAWSHADLQTDPGDVIAAYRRWCGAPDPERLLVKGVRSGRALGERVITWGMQILATVLLTTPLHEINAQPKLFHRDLLKELSAPPVDFNLDLYILYRARQAGWRFLTIPVSFPPRQYGESNWSATWRSKLRTIWRSIRFMIRLG